jgi:hypothetical protein
VGEDEMPAFPFRRPADAGTTSLRSEQPGAVSRPQLAASIEMRLSGEVPRLSAEAIRLLKATLFELGECRRLLDAGRGEPS